MQAPDKIYLEKPKGCTGNLIGYAYKENKGLYDLSPTEYIRKNAILEWAKETEKSRMRVPIEAYNNEDYQAGFIDGFAKFRRILIEKLESL